MMEKFVYRGNYEQVKQKICDDYRADSVELCGFFDAVTPDLTITEAVKLFAELRQEIDGDTVIHFVEGIAMDLGSDTAVSAGETMNLLQKATVNCLITYPEADCKPDVLAFSAPTNLSQQQIVELFEKTVAANATMRSTDRLAQLDSVIRDMEHRYGCDCHGIHIHCCTEIK